MSLGDLSAASRYATNGRREPTTDQLFWAGISGLVYLPASVAPVGLTRSGLPYTSS